jgi:prevent-host-death family protein
MTSRVGTFEAKTHLSELLDRVEKGETITITRHGTEVARLVPVAAPAPSRHDLVAEFKHLRKQVSGQPVTVSEIREWITEGRR